MTKIYIARHGQDEDNAAGLLNGHRNMPLTEKGLAQAHELADGIRDAGLTFDRVYCSPLRRAKKTAEVICETLGLPEPVVMESLIERDFGEMSGRKISEIEELCAPDLLRSDPILYFLSPSGGETFPTVLKRAARALEEVRTMHPHGPVLLVTHGDIGKMLYASYYNLDWKDVLVKFHFGNCELLALAEDSHADESHVIRIEQHNH